MRSFRPITAILVLLSSAALAQPPAGAPAQPISLMEALRQAIAGNVDLRRERVNIANADAAMLTARGAFDFQLTSALSFQRSTQPPLTSQDIQSGFTNDLGFDLGLRRNLETGGSLSLSLQNDQFYTNSRLNCGTLAGVANCTYYQSILGLTFSHPLLQGFGLEITEANLRKARIQKDQALLNRQLRASNVMRDVIVAYWELAYATQDLAIHRSAVAQAQEQLRITKAQIDVGRLAAVDQAAVEEAIASRLADTATSEQNLYFRTLDLRRLLGIPEDAAQPPYTAADAPSVTGHDVDPVAEVRHALEVNPQLKALKVGMELSAIDLQTARDTLKPTLNFVGTIGSRGKNPGLSETLAQAIGLDQLTWSAALNFQAPLENRAARGAVRNAEGVMELARLDAGTLELGIRDSVLRYTAQIRSASTRVDLGKRAVTFAQQNLEAEKARFSVGRSTNNDVLLRQVELNNAQIAEVRAEVDLLDADINLSAITGEILDRYNVGLKGL